MTESTPEEVAADADQRIGKALNFASEYGWIDGDHHKQWVIDQMVRALTGCPPRLKTRTDAHGHACSYEVQGESQEYLNWIGTGPDDEYNDWDEGIAP